MPAYTRRDYPNAYAPAIWFNANGGPVACLIPMRYAAGRFTAFIITDGGTGMREIGHILSTAEGIARVESILDEQTADVTEASAA
jgi:hypothetical protein